MNSRWMHLKPAAITLRKRGLSLKEIEKRLSIPRSTLSGWLRGVCLSGVQLKKLKEKQTKGLIHARVRAAEWHRAKKEERVAYAENEALKSLKHLDQANLATLELALAMLYWGEGSKRLKGLNVGNTNPKLLNFFISALRLLYNIEIPRLSCELHLRADQNPKKEARYWAEALGLKMANFKRTYNDKRTEGKKTFSEYHGVCLVSYNDVAIQRKLMYLYTLYCQGVILKAHA